MKTSRILILALLMCLVFSLPVHALSDEGAEEAFIQEIEALTQESKIPIEPLTPDGNA